MTNDKLTGSFYTPHNLVNYMVDYVSKRICPRTILEPSAGDGRFISPLLKFNAPITAIEFEEGKVKGLTEKFGDLCTILDSDFLEFSLKHGTKFDLIIGNPPYITKKMMPKEQCDRSFKLVNQFSLNGSLFQNMWVSFLLASIKLLSPAGAIFFVLPFEFLQVQYAEKLRTFLEKKFNTIEITTFEDRIFTDIEQDVCLVYFSNEKTAKPFIRYTTLKSDKDIRDLEQLKYVIEDRTIAALLGEQNFTNKESAILELVKNAYDAGATLLTISFDRDAILVADNGLGMDADDIRRNWMHIGKSDKDYKIIDSDNHARVLAGSKGIGRFALARLGELVSVCSWKGNLDVQGICWITDWNHSSLSSDHDLTEQGTKIEIQKLRDKWTPKAIEKSS